MPKSLDSLIDKVVTAWRRKDVTATAGEIAVGLAAHRAVCFRLAKRTEPAARRTARSEVLVAIAGKLESEGCRKGNIGRAIASSQVAMEFSPSEAKTLPIATIRQFARLIRRNSKKEEWSIKPKVSAQAIALWSRVVAGDVDAAAVRSEVDRVLSTTPRLPRSKPTAALAIAKVLAGATEEDLASALASLKANDQDAFRRLFVAAKSLAPKRKPETPSIDSPRKTVFGREKAA